MRNGQNLTIVASPVYDVRRDGLAMSVLTSVSFDMQFGPLCVSVTFGFTYTISTALTYPSSAKLPSSLLCFRGGLDPSPSDNFLECLCVFVMDADVSLPEFNTDTKRYMEALEDGIGADTRTPESPIALPSHKSSGRFTRNVTKPPCKRLHCQGDDNDCPFGGGTHMRDACVPYRWGVHAIFGEAGG